MEEIYFIDCLGRDQAVLVPLVLFLVPFSLYALCGLYSPIYMGCVSLAPHFLYSYVTLRVNPFGLYCSVCPEH